MSDLKLALHILTENWRSTGRKTRQSAGEIPNLLARGHMHGVGDGLDIAADDVEDLLEKPEEPEEPVKPV